MWLSRAVVYVMLSVGLGIARGDSQTTDISDAEDLSEVAGWVNNVDPPDVPPENLTQGSLRIVQAKWHNPNFNESNIPLLGEAQVVNVTDPEGPNERNITAYFYAGEFHLRHLARSCRADQSLTHYLCLPSEPGCAGDAIWTLSAQEGCK